MLCLRRIHLHVGNFSPLKQRGTDTYDTATSTSNPTASVATESLHHVILSKGALAGIVGGGSLLLFCTFLVSAVLLRKRKYSKQCVTLGDTIDLLDIVS